MPTESGYSNQKKLGQNQYKTIHNVGSDKFADNVVTKGLVERQTVNIAITDVDLSVDQKTVTLEVIGHGALRAGEVLRFYTGGLATVELDIVDVVDANIIEVLNVMEALPQVGDEVRTAYYRTPQFDSTGNITVNSGPAQFVQDGVDVEVEQDTVDPTNNKPLPAGLYFYKNGVIVPVNKDTGTPANTAAVPVEIVAASGTAINITAGDIDIHTTDLGVNFDALRLGDGSGVYLQINADGSINVVDADVLAELQTLNLVDFATEAKQDSQITELQDINTELSTLNLVDFATEAKQDSQITELQSINTELDAQSVLIGAVNEAAPGTDTASSGLNGRLQRIAQRLTSLIALLPTSLGQKTAANSLAVVMASDYVPPAPAVAAALTVKNATIDVGVVAVRATTDGAAPSATRRKLRIFMDPDTTTGKLYLGSATVTSGAGATRGEQIFPGAPVVIDNDVNDYYIISDTALNKVSIVEVE